MKRYFGGCDVGSTYTKCVMLDEEGKMAAHTTIKSRMNSEKSARTAMEETLSLIHISPGKNYKYRSSASDAKLFPDAGQAAFREPAATDSSQLL